MYKCYLFLSDNSDDTLSQALYFTSFFQTNSPSFNCIFLNFLFVCLCSQFPKIDSLMFAHLSSLVSWNKKMSEKKCFTNFLQVLKDHIKSRVWNFFGEGFLRKSYLKFFYYITQSGYLSQKLHSICLSFGSWWFPLKKIFAQGVLGLPWLNKSAGNITRLLLRAIFCTK